MAELTNRQQAIADILTEEHCGRANAITSKELALAVGSVDDAFRGTPVTRADIRTIVEENNIPIGACNAGYFVIESRSELRDYCDNLRSRAYGIMHREMLVSRAFFQS